MQFCSRRWLSLTCLVLGLHAPIALHAEQPVGYFLGAGAELDAQGHAWDTHQITCSEDLPALQVIAVSNNFQPVLLLQRVGSDKIQRGKLQPAESKNSASRAAAAVITPGQYLVYVSSSQARDGGPYLLYTERVSPRAEPAPLAAK